MTDNTDPKDNVDEKEEEVVDFSEISLDLLDNRVKAWHENELAGLKANQAKLFKEKAALKNKIDALTAQLAEQIEKNSEIEEASLGVDIKEAVKFYNERKDLKSDAGEQEYLDRGRRAMQDELKPQIDKLEHQNKKLQEENEQLKAENINFRTIGPIESAVQKFEDKNFRRMATILLKEDWKYDSAYGRLVGVGNDGEVIIDAAGAPKTIEDYVQDGSIYKEYPALNPKPAKGLNTIGSEAAKLGFDDNPWSTKTRNLTQQRIIETTNPELATRLKAQAQK